jgi:predicted tellurium resistance membrane protein TerC
MNASDIVALVSLSILLLVLSLDNAVFISLLSSGLPEPSRTQTRKRGLLLACGSNLAMLFVVGLVKKLERPIFTLASFEPTTGRDLVLIVGGLILIGKATSELHDKLEGKQEAHVSADALRPGKILMQIALLNLIFSIDSVLTAVGMADQLEIMIASMFLASVGLYIFGDQVGQFVMSHPTLKVLALSFLILIGSNLIVEGAHVEIPKGYTYFAMAFSVAVEMVNLKIKERGAAVKLHQPRLAAETGSGGGEDSPEIPMHP